MRVSVPLLALGTIAVLFGGSCGSSPAAPSAPASPTGNPTAATLGGTWTGSISDSQGSAAVTWTMVQSGSTLTGTAVTRPVDPDDGTCASCHKNKIGSLTGTLSGTALALTLAFPGGRPDEPTPICRVTMSVTAPATADDQITATYVGEDSCEGPLSNGRVTLARQR